MKDEENISAGISANIWAKLSILIFSSIVCLIFSELFARWWLNYKILSFTLVPPAESLALSNEHSKLTEHLDQKYINEIPIAKNVDRSLYSLELPPPKLSNMDLEADRIARFQEFGAKGLYSPQSYYVWNRSFVEDKSFRDSRFYSAKLDLPIDVFRPLNGNSRPRYRNPVSERLPSGLITNKYGWRGDDLKYQGDPRQILLAFVGASTTIDHHKFRYSHPELVGFWLNKWAVEHGFEVHFDIINAGREGITSKDIVQIIEQEIAPFKPDLIIYHEGSNQFIPSSAIDNQDSPVSQRYKEIAKSKLTQLIRNTAVYSALIKMVERLIWNIEGSLMEPSKPDYSLRAVIQEENPDPFRTDLPLNLPQIINDLDTINQKVKTFQGRLLISSFTWFAREGLVLDADRHRHIYDQLNGFTWPLRYSDIKRVSDFQNRVFKNYCNAKDLRYLDVDSMLPHDPDLFIDAIHMTEPGIRIRGWILFNMLVPIIEGGLRSGDLPRKDLPRNPDPWDYGLVERISLETISKSN